jgi:hypothetical protein
MPFKPAYHTEQDVRSYFALFADLVVRNKNDKKKFDRGIYIDGSTRKEILTGVNQGTLLLQGQWCSYVFVDLGGGVYKVSTDYSYNL